MTRSAITPAEPSQKTEVTSQLIAAGGGCQEAHQVQLNRRVGLHDRDGYRHPDDREAEPESVGRPAAGCAPATRPQRRGAQPLGQVTTRPGDILADNRRHGRSPA